MAKKIKKRYKRFRFPVIGKYIDTPTKAEIGVVYFVDDVGTYNLSTDNVLKIVLKGCKFQIKLSEVKYKRKFYKRFKPFLEFSSGFKELESPENFQVPLSFGLLKLRKGKQRFFILIQGADTFYKHKLVNVSAAKIDNLLYMELVNKLKKKP